MRAAAFWRRHLLSALPRVFARWCHPDAHELGELGEELAARELRARGYTILSRRVRTRFAEIDIVARDRGEIVCVEVKTAHLVTVPVPQGSEIDPVLPPFRRRGRLSRVQTERLMRAARQLAREQHSVVRLERAEVALSCHAPRVRVTLRRIPLS